MLALFALFSIAFAQAADKIDFGEIQVMTVSPDQDFLVFELASSPKLSEQKMVVNVNTLLNKDQKDFMTFGATICANHGSKNQMCKTFEADSGHGIFQFLGEASVFGEKFTPTTTAAPTTMAPTSTMAPSTTSEMGGTTNMNGTTNMGGSTTGGSTTGGSTVAPSTTAPATTDKTSTADATSTTAGMSTTSAATTTAAATTTTAMKVEGTDADSDLFDEYELFEFDADKKKNDTGDLLTFSIKFNLMTKNGTDPKTNKTIQVPVPAIAVVSVSYINTVESMGGDLSLDSGIVTAFTRGPENPGQFAQVRAETCDGSDMDKGQSLRVTGDVSNMDFTKAQAPFMTNQHEFAQCATYNNYTSIALKKGEYVDCDFADQSANLGASADLRVRLMTVVGPNIAMGYDKKFTVPTNVTLRVKAAEEALTKYYKGHSVRLAYNEFSAVAPTSLGVEGGFPKKNETVKSFNLTAMVHPLNDVNGTFRLYAIHQPVKDPLFFNIDTTCQLDMALGMNKKADKGLAYLVDTIPYSDNTTITKDGNFKYIVDHAKVSEQFTCTKVKGKCEDRINYALWYQSANKDSTFTFASIALLQNGQKAPTPPMGPSGPEEEKPNNTWIYIICAILGVVAIGGIALWIGGRKKADEPSFTRV